MARPKKWTKEKIDTKATEVFELMKTEGLSLRKILERNGMPSRTIFYQWMKEYKELTNHYAHAHEERADLIFDEILEIADNSNADYTGTREDGSLIINRENIQRSKLKIDARKWSLAKMQPKKYGNKVDITTDREKINYTIPLVLSEGRTYNDLVNDLKKEEGV